MGFPCRFHCVAVMLFHLSEHEWERSVNEFVFVAKATMATFSPFQTVGGGTTTASRGCIAPRAERLCNSRTCGARRGEHHVTRCLTA